MIQESKSTDTIAIIAIIVSVLTALIGFLRAVFFNRPRLTIDLRNTIGQSQPKGYSSKTPIIEEKNHCGEVIKVYDGNNAISFFSCEWEFEVTITNNSPNTAYFTEMIFIKDAKRFTSIQKLNKNSPIPSEQKIVLAAKYKMVEECHGRDRTNTGKFPIDLNDLEILLQYNNKFRVKFASIYRYSRGNPTNRFIRFKPKRFNFKYYC